MNRRAYEDPSIGFAVAMAMTLAGRRSKRRIVHRTPAQIEADERRAERAGWNAEVEARKAEKLAAKSSQEPHP